jgi:hypothetical protein
VIENDVDAEAFNVGEHVLHQLRSLQVRGTAGPVLDFRRRGQLAALLHAGDEDRIEARAGGVDGRRVTCGPGTQYDQAVVL